MKTTRYMTPLSRDQQKQLCTLASRAFKAAKSRGAVDDDMTADQYRKQGQFEAAKVESLKDANQGHYLEIRGKWWTVIGNLEQAFYDFLNAGPENEARRQMAWRLAGQVSALAEAMGDQKQDKALAEAVKTLPPGEMVLPVIPRLTEPELAGQAWAYTLSIAADRFKTRRMDSLDADALEQLGFTIVNRASAMRGVGDSTRRNKSQRRRSKTSKKPLEPDSRGSSAFVHDGGRFFREPSESGSNHL